MKIVLIAIVALFAGYVVGILTARRTIERQRQTIRALRAKRPVEKKRVETMKKIVWVCLINGFLWVWCSYILAGMDKPQIAESLSQVAVTQIIGVVLSYAIKSAVENLSKNNRWPDKGTDATPADGTTGPEAERTEPLDVGL